MSTCKDERFIPFQGRRDRRTKPISFYNVRIMRLGADDTNAPARLE